MNPQKSQLKLMFLLLFVVLTAGISQLYGQVDFRKGFEAANPAPLNTQIDWDERIRLHREFDERARISQNELQILYAKLYFFYDYVIKQDYTEANTYLLEALKIADKSGNQGWLGWTTYRQGLLYAQLKSEVQAIEAFQLAASLCASARDSLCMAESLEQVAAMNGQISNFEEAEKYFDLALPLIEKFGTEETWANSLNNYGIMLFNMGKIKESLTYYNKSITINSRNNVYRAKAQAMNNLANSYTELGMLDTALVIYQECIRLNNQHGYLTSLISNYGGLNKLYEKKGDYQLANEYLNSFYELKDSLMGIATIRDIEQSKARFDIENLPVEKSLWSGKLFFIGALLVGLCMAILIRLWKKADIEINATKESMDKMTQIVKEKDLSIMSLKEQMELESKHDQDSKESLNLFETRILTHEDWESFKVYFENAFPNYLSSLRTVHPDMTEAEERLFLLTKLKLNLKEVATILGISPDSVKKTRYRLKKRLNIGKDDSLEAYILEF